MKNNNKKRLVTLGFTSKLSSLNPLFLMLSLSLALAATPASALCPNLPEQFPYVEEASIPFFEDLPFKVVTKRWSAADGTKSYFDQQRSLLNFLSQQSIPTSEQTLTVAAVGDLMRTPPEHDSFVSAGTKQQLHGYDLVFANLETLVSDSYPNPPNFFFEMNSDPSLVTAFNKSDGSSAFSALSIANNHTYDYPDNAITDTMDFLDAQNIPHTGVQKNAAPASYNLVEKNGIRVGFYAATTFVNQTPRLEDTNLHLNMLEGLRPVPGETWLPVCELDLEPIKNALMTMDEDGVDLKIVNIHWGVEYEMYPRPLQLQITRELVAAGADVIIGAHPHVPQPLEICFVNGAEGQLPADLATAQQGNGCTIQTPDAEPRKALIYYSLGNFTSGSPTFWQQLGLLGDFTVTKDSEGKVDWWAPSLSYFFSERSSSNPLDASRQFYTMDEYLAANCFQEEECSADVLNSLATLDQHLKGSSLSRSEEWRVIYQNLVNAVRTFLF